ncbi:MAG: hypothetical protein V5A68_08395, partial [Candidatus Thermoplasmatota archaeon]
CSPKDYSPCYGKRWGIETSYRVKKHSYLPQTTSKNYQIRLFYFLFSVLLYNLWIGIYGSVDKDHLITSKLFAAKLLFQGRLDV